MQSMMPSMPWSAQRLHRRVDVGAAFLPAPTTSPTAAGLIKLDAMENPYGWPDALREDWLATLREAELNRYPDPRARELQQALREAMGIPADMALLLGNGSDELIQMLAMAVAAPGPNGRARCCRWTPASSCTG
jgi:histidinol-phosphate/aromatic aminotransferase/cobyric acid decarboxylase-like protein